MSVRQLIAQIEDLRSINVSRFAVQHAIHRDSVYAIHKRCKAEGEAGLVPRSRAPKRVANRTSGTVEDLVVGLRKELVDAGLDAGAETIHYWLRERHGSQITVPSSSTIWRVLRRRGFVVADPTKAPKRRPRSFVAERANECWQIDFTHWELADGTPVEIIDIIDDCSRVVPRSLVTSRCTLATVWAAMTDAAQRYGWPERVLSDNGAVFGSTFAENLAAAGIAIGHSRPYHPQTCGKVERFHQTLKQRLAVYPANTIEELQAIVDTFIDYYNHQRPHRGIGRRNPHDVWKHTPRSGPANQPLGMPTAIYTGRVYDGIVWAGRYRISVGNAHNTKQATIAITGLHAHIVADGRLIRELTINPARADQTLHKRPGRPTQ
jgi:transposase InsO family protein